MELAEKVHPHTPAQMNGEANRGMEDRERTGPDSHVPTEIEANGVGTGAKNVERTDQKRVGEERHSGIGRRHTQPMAYVRRRSEAVEEKEKSATEGQQDGVAYSPFLPVGAERA